LSNHRYENSLVLQPRKGYYHGRRLIYCRGRRRPLIKSLSLRFRRFPKSTKFPRFFWQTWTYLANPEFSGNPDSFSKSDINGNCGFFGFSFFSHAMSSSKLIFCFNYEKATDVGNLWLPQLPGLPDEPTIILHYYNYTTTKVVVQSSVGTRGSSWCWLMSHRTSRTSHGRDSGRGERAINVGPISQAAATAATATAAASETAACGRTQDYSSIGGYSTYLLLGWPVVRTYRTEP